MLADAQDAEIVLWRVYFGKVLAISSFPAVLHIKILIGDNLTHPTSKRSSSLSITDRPSTKQIHKDFCCNYLTEELPAAIASEKKFKHRGAFYIYCLI